MLSSAWFLDTLRCVFMLKINGLVRNLIFFWNLNQFFLINFNNLNRLDNKNCISCFSFLYVLYAILWRFWQEIIKFLLQLFRVDYLFCFRQYV
jgi:hypothetical protein